MIYLSEEKDMVNHPPHYNIGKFEVIDVIEDWKLGFHLGNAVKYIARAQHKNNEIEDLEKSIWYIKRKVKCLNESIKEIEERIKELKNKYGG